MKFLILLFAISLPILFTSKVNAQVPNPALSYSQSERLVFLDNEKNDDNVVTFEAKFKPDGCKKTGVIWEFNGTPKKDWEIVNGSLETDVVKIKFKAVGIYSFTLTATYQYTAPGEEEAEEDEVSIEAESILTVTKNLDELTQIHADSNYLKLVKKASSYLVKPEYVEDPTPNIFLAKGYYGIYKKQLDDPIVDDPLSATVDCIAAAMELDLNGIYNVSIHKIWLNKFQSEWFNNEIIGNLDEEDGYYIPYSGSDKEIKQERNDLSIEGCEVYASISKYPISIKLMEAALRYDAKDIKTANSIWKTEIAKLSELSEEDFENMTETDLSALKYGAMLSASMLTEISASNSQACQILNSIKKVFEYDRTFNAFFKTKYNNCTEE